MLSPYLFVIDLIKLPLSDVKVKKAVLDAGCEMFQGYYFYQPVAAAQLKKLLKKQERFVTAKIRGQLRKM